MDQSKCWDNRNVRIHYDPDTMECIFSDRNRGIAICHVKLRIPLICTFMERDICFMLSVIKWNSVRVKKGVRITFELKAEEESGELCPDLNYSLFLPDQGSYVEEEAAITVGKSVELVSFSIPWRLKTVSNAEYLPIPFSDSGIKPGLAPLENIAEGIHLYEGLLFKFEGYGLVAARVPKDQKPQWIALSKSNSGKISVAGIQAGLKQESDSGKEKYHPPVLSANEAFPFLKTRYMLYAGGENEGLYLYRDFMKDRGICVPRDYQPPFNYCIYYEYPGYFQKEELLKEADLAASLGCTLLYTDQGWEDYFGNGIWDKTRLGEIKELIGQISEKGLGLGILVGMHMKAFGMPENVYRRDAAGKIENGDPWHYVGVCAQSPVWQRKKRSRLKKLALQGISFMSFDFNNYENICYSTEHNHAGPSDEWGHAAALAELQTKLKKECPGLLIEAHDWINAGTYTYPVYLFPQACHERWGFEYMWTPFEDFKSGRLRNLYYYNMAYEKPLYLHIDLANDSEHMAVFWYIASTVRHLGIGNYKGVEEDRKAVCQEAIARYCKIREYLVNGTFQGINPLIHIHELEGKGVLLLLFNDKADKKQIRLKLTQLEETTISECWERMELIWGSGPDRGMKNGDGSVSVWLDAYDVSVIWLPCMCADHILWLAD